MQMLTRLNRNLAVSQPCFQEKGEAQGMVNTGEVQEISADV